jgi:hypothetical protein
MALPFGQERDWSPPDQTLRPTLPKQRVPGDPPREGQIFHRVTSAVLGPQAAHGLVSNPKVMSPDSRCISRRNVEESPGSGGRGAR